MGAMAQPPCPRGLVESSTWKVERNIKKLPPSFFDLSRSWVVNRLQNLSHYPALSAAGRRMPDDRRSHSKPENLDLHALCAKRITRLFPEWRPWLSLKIPFKRDTAITTATQAMGFCVRHPASSVWQSAGYSR